MTGDKSSNRILADPHENGEGWLELMLSEKQRLDQEVAVAREIQFSTLPSEMPQIPGYDMHGHFVPADHAGGDLFDLVLVNEQLFILLGDATGHGFGPALSATQMQAMLRVAFRCGADLDTACLHVNNQMDEDLPADRFITAFIGFLDPGSHRVRYHAFGQGPILHFDASGQAFNWHGPTTFPVGAVAISRVESSACLELGEGDYLVLLSDGVYETHNDQGTLFGRDGVEQVVRENSGVDSKEMVHRILEAAALHRAGGALDDDITAVIVRRQQGAAL